MNRTLLLLSGALLVGGFFVFWLYQQEFREESAGGAMIPVVTAAVDIRLGTPVRAEWLTTKDVPQNYLEDRHLRVASMRDLVGLPLAQTVRAGEAILRTDLSTLSDARRTLSGSIPEGARAATIMVREASNFGGLLRPGDRVDVLLTVGNRENRETWRQVVLLENLLMLAVGQEFEVRDTPGASGENPEIRYGRANNVTLQVSIEQSGLLTAARQRGVMTLLLRNPNDIRVEATRADLLATDIFEPSRRARFLRRNSIAPPRVDPAAVGAPSPAGSGAVVVPGAAAGATR